MATPGTGRRLMRILIRTSKWAIWARRFGSFALPLAIIPILMHRERMIETPTFHLLEGVAAMVAVLSLALALGAFVRLWLTGDQGWGKATMALVFAAIVLLPLAFGAVQAVRYPAVYDVTTDPSDPPQLISGLPATPQTPDVVAKIRVGFPNVQPRNYPIDPAQMFTLAEALARARGWDMRFRRVPQGSSEGQLNAIAMRPLGWRDEVAVRIRATAKGHASTCGRLRC